MILGCEFFDSHGHLVAAIHREVAKLREMLHQIKALRMNHLVFCEIRQPPRGGHLSAIQRSMIEATRTQKASANGLRAPDARMI
jgi:hypothetical protein